MIRGNLRIRSGVLVIGAALVAMMSSRGEAAAIDAGSGTVVLRGADSQPEASVPIANGGPVVLRGSPPKPAPEQSACRQGYYDDPNQGCLAPEDAYTPDYGYWPPYGLGWPYFDLRHRHPSRLLSSPVPSAGDPLRAPPGRGPRPGRLPSFGGCSSLARIKEAPERLLDRPFYGTFAAPTLATSPSSSGDPPSAASARPWQSRRDRPGPGSKHPCPAPDAPVRGRGTAWSP